MSSVFLGNKVIDLSPRKIKKVPTTLLKIAKTNANKEYKYLSQFKENPLDTLCANVWKSTVETISLELKKRKTVKGV